MNRKETYLINFFILCAVIILFFFSNNILAAQTVPAPPLEYNKNDIENRDATVELEKGQTLIVYSTGIKKTLSTTPNIISASVRSDTEVGVVAKELGTCYVHIWDDSGRWVFRIVTKQVGYTAQKQISEKEIEEGRPETFKIRYSFTSDRNFYHSDNSTYQYKTGLYTHNYLITGQTPYGDFTSEIQREKRDNISDYTKFTTRLKNDKYDISYGDNYADLSNFTIASTHFQGLDFKYKLSDKFKYNFVYGADGYRIWGDRLLFGSSGKSKYFYGGRATFNVTDNFFLYTAASKIRGKVIDEDMLSTQNSAYGFDYHNKILGLSGEYGIGKEGRAWRSDWSVTTKKINVYGTFSDVDPEYVSTTGYVTGRGQKGFKIGTRISPFEILNFGTQYEKYRDRLYPNIEDPLRYNVDITYFGQLNLPTQTSFIYTSWNRDRRGYQTPSQFVGSTYEISQQFHIFGRNIKIYGRYEPQKSMNYSSSISDYKNRRYLVGGNISLFKNLNLSLSQAWNRRKKFNDSYDDSPRRFYAKLSYSSQVFKLPIFYSTSIFYQKDQNISESGTSVFSGEDFIGVSGNLRYIPIKDTECFANFECKKVQGTVDSTLDRLEYSIYTGVRTLFDTKFRLEKKCTVKGIAFNDTNGNGQFEKDKGEGPIVGAQVSLEQFGKTRKTVTDKNGFYIFGGVTPGKSTVKFNTDNIPDNMSISTANPKPLIMQQGDIEDANFGVFARSEVMGYVYNDINMNKKFDSAIDLPAEGVKLSVDDTKKAYSGGEGHFYFGKVIAGDHVISLDTKTLPKDFMLAIPAKKKFTVHAGERFSYDFPVYTLRSVGGFVYVDANNNGTKEPEESGISDIVVSCAGTITVTDSKGYYSLKKLPGGENKVEVDLTSLPEDYELIGDDFALIKLSEKGEIKENVNFVVKKKQ